MLRQDLEMILEDCFICGIKKGLIFNRLCEEINDVTFEKCLEISCNKEVSLEIC